MTVGAGAASSRLATPADTPKGAELAGEIANADGGLAGKLSGTAAPDGAYSRVAVQLSGAEIATMFSIHNVLAAVESRLLS